MPDDDYVAAPEGDSLIVYQQDGCAKRTTPTFFRGPQANFHPTDESLSRPDALLEYALKGLTPREPFIDRRTAIVAFGSCFAANISNHLTARGYRVLNRDYPQTYVASMGDGIVNTYALRQQFEWAWEGRRPTGELWHGFDAAAFGYDEEIRVATRAMFDEADVFIVTLGLSEVWFDEPTGEVFWRAVPFDKHDPRRHKFRVTSVEENRQNLEAIGQLIAIHRPDATLITTLSPVPLTATFRPRACGVANAASKAILRAAIDEWLRGPAAGATFYFPSYEIVTTLFQHPFMEDRKHPHHHVLDLNMRAFEHAFCVEGGTVEALAAAFGEARRLDRKVGTEGHFSVERRMTPKAGGAVAAAAD